METKLNSFLVHTVPATVGICVAFGFFAHVQPFDKKDAFFEVKNFAAFVVASLTGLSVYSRFEKNEN